MLFCQGRINLIRGATLISRKTVRLAGTNIPRQLTYAHTSQLFTAPSAAHLTNCFSPGSQHPGFSVQAYPPLLPLHRFKLIEVFNLHRL